MATPVSSSQNPIQTMEFYENDIISKVGEEIFRKMQLDNPSFPIRTLILPQIARQYPDKAEKIAPILQSMEQTWRPTQMLALFKQMAEIEGLLEEEDKKPVNEIIKNMESEFLNDLKEWHTRLIEKEKNV